MIPAAILASQTMKPLRWEVVAPGVWRCQIGRADRTTLTKTAEAKPKLDPLKQMPLAEAPFDLNEIRAWISSSYASVQLPLTTDEKVFGLGMQMSGANRRGEVFHLQVDHYEKGHDRLHVPTPLYISDRGYAVFFNTIRPINVYVGVGNRLDDPKHPMFRDRNTDPKWDAQPDSSAVEASVQASGLEVLVFAGPTSMDALRRYNLYSGGGAMPPMWALGFWHRLRSLATAKDVESEVQSFEEKHFPLDVIGLEPGWQSRSYPGSMEWSTERFPDPAGFVQGLKSKGIHVNLWENPYVAPGSNLYNALAPRFGSHTVWLGAAPDIADPKAAEILRKFHQQNHTSIGVSGYKIDEVDGFDVWLWPDHAQFPSGLDGLPMRQIYGVLWQRELDRLFHQENQRTFGLVRGSNGAASRFPFALYSDTYDHQQYLTALTTSPLAGVLWCAEIRSAESSEEWSRRMQSAVLSPIAQLNAWDSGKKPWSFPDVDDVVRDAMQLRQTLIPYLYTTFAQYCLEGTPPIRPMCLVDGGLETDQYLLGDNLLAAPVAAGQKSRSVRLPAGEWYDYRSGTYVGSHQTIRISPKLDEIPLYVRGGSAIPTYHGQLHVAAYSASEPYHLRCYGKGPWRAAVYDDDRVTYAFEKGNYGLFDVTIDGQAATATHRAGKWTTLQGALQIDLMTKE